MNRLSLSSIAALIVFLALATAGCTDTDPTVLPDSESASFVRGAYWEDVPFRAPAPQRDPADWEDVPIMVGLALDLDQCAPGSTTCTEPAFWETIPLVLRDGMREHTGDDLLYLRHEPTILDIVSRMESRYPELSGSRDLASDPASRLTAVGTMIGSEPLPGLLARRYLGLSLIATDALQRGLQLLADSTVIHGRGLSPHHLFLAHTNVLYEARERLARSLWDDDIAARAKRSLEALPRHGEGRRHLRAPTRTLGASGVS